MTTTDVQAFFDSSDYDDEKLESFRFDAIGDTAKGIIAKPPKMVEFESKFGKGMERKLLLVLEDAGVRRNLWVSGQMATAIKDAYAEAGAPGLAEGGTLGVKFDSNKDTGKGYPMKVYRAQYKAPAPSAAPAVDDFFASTPESTPVTTGDLF